MTNPEPIWLPWSAREVRLGDVLSIAEVQELLVIQRGRHPLYPMLQGSSTFLLEEPTPQNVLARLLTPEDDLTIGELEAAAWLHREDYAAPVFVPIGNGQMVAMPWTNVSPLCVEAYFEWRDMLERSN